MQVGLIARGNLQNPGFGLGKTLLVEPCPQRPGNGAARRQKRPDIGVPRRCPPWRRSVGSAACGVLGHLGHLRLCVTGGRTSTPPSVTNRGPSINPTFTPNYEKP